MPPTAGKSYVDADTRLLQAFKTPSMKLRSRFIFYFQGSNVEKFIQNVKVNNDINKLLFDFLI